MSPRCFSKERCANVPPIMPAPIIASVRRAIEKVPSE
jgi:hypothetical protein